MQRQRHLFGSLTAAALLALASVSGSAQTTGAAPGGTGTNGCADTQLQPRQGADPQLQGKGGDNLSSRLAQSGGVICPPSEVDPQMKAPTPQTGDTPVIPPPGSPGGNPSVRPK